MAAEGIDVRAEAAHDAAADADAATDDPPAVGAGARTDADKKPGRWRVGRDHETTSTPTARIAPRRAHEAENARRTVARLENELADARRASLQRRRRRRNASRFVGERWRTSRRRAPRALPPRTPRAHFIFRTSSCTRDRMIYRLVTSRRCWADTRVWRFNTKPCQGRRGGVGVRGGRDCADGGVRAGYSHAVFT